VTATPTISAQSHSRPMRILFNPTLTFALLFVGCDSVQSLQKPLPNGTFAMQIVARHEVDDNIIELAEVPEGTTIRDGENVVARWLPLWPGSPAENDSAAVKELVVRESANGKEMLLLTNAFDVTEKHIVGTHYVQTVQGDNLVYVWLSDDGGRNARQLSASVLAGNNTNSPGRVAMIVRGQVYSVSEVDNVVSGQIAIRTGSVTDGQKIESILLGANAKTTNTE